MLAIDKPPGWMLAPDSWDRTGRNLQLALESSIKAHDFWARSRGLKFLRFVHRLDAETSGVLLLVKSPGAMRPYSALFESREMEKIYLGVVRGSPPQAQWTCKLAIAPDPDKPGRMKTVTLREREKSTFKHGAWAEGRDTRKEGGRTEIGNKALQSKTAETHFRVLGTRHDRSLLEARPLTGRTHQIRVHLQASGCPVIGDFLYGKEAVLGSKPELALRAIGLAYRDPFTKKHIRIEAPSDSFLKAYGFAGTP